MVAYVMWGVRRRGGSLRDLIGGRWDRARDSGRNVLVALGFWIVALVVLGLLGWALAVNRNLQGIRFLIPGSGLEIACWILLSITAGCCEETIFRGYLQRQFIAWSGNAVAGILFSALLFGAAHAYQGWRQAVRVGVFGAMFGILAYRRGSLRPGIIAHAWNDTVSGFVLHFVIRKGLAGS